MKSIVLFCFLLTSNLVFGQTISGIINTYTAVTGTITNTCTACPPTVCHSTIPVVSSTGFTVGGRAVIIQMQGAILDQTNTAAFGNVTSYNNAGNYEFFTISALTGTSITSSIPLKETYSAPAGAVQVLNVPQYTNVTISATLTAAAWNGTTGGVLAFEATGTVTLNANIDVSGLGFRPIPEASRQQGGAACATDDQYYFTRNYYNNTPPVPSGAAGLYADGRSMTGNDAKYGAFKGEGIAVFVTNMEKGKGKWANGGGGGNVLNAGGGGGGNGGGGGYGGNTFSQAGACTNAQRISARGIGGLALTRTTSQAFLGGSGGEGQWDGAAILPGSSTCGNIAPSCNPGGSNNSNIGIGGSNGAQGAGIILISAATVTNGGAFTISANGTDNTNCGVSDGQGGGGAGGTILLNVNAFSNAITVNAKGGRGGDHSNNTCHGAGGGGGGGVICLKTASANVTSNVAGGRNGWQQAGTVNTDCWNGGAPLPGTTGSPCDWGSTPGAAGIFAVCPSAGPLSSILNENGCTLPLTLLKFFANVEDSGVKIYWLTTNEINIKKFEIQRSYDAINFSTIGNAEPANTASINNYVFTDPNGTSYPGPVYYRLKQVEADDSFEYSHLVSVNLQGIQENSVSYYPNPVKSGDPLIIDFKADINKPVTFKLFNLLGIQVHVSAFAAKEGFNQATINTTGLSKGVYLLELMQDNYNIFRQVLVE
jgi:hypothetical protein